MDRNEAGYQPALIVEASKKVTCCYQICCFSVSIDGKSGKTLMSQKEVCISFIKILK